MALDGGEENGSTIDSPPALKQSKRKFHIKCDEKYCVAGFLE
jgi:hypothetical protein